MKSKIPKIKPSDLKLIGKRIILRPLKISDAQDLYLNIQDKKISENTASVPWPYKLKDAINFIKRSQKKRKNKEGFSFGTILKGKKEVIGSISLKINFNHKNAEMGYWLGKKFRNQGIMTEAGQLILEFAFRRLKLHRLGAGVFHDNPASQKVLKKLGFQKEGVSRQSYWRGKHWRNRINYGILIQDFLKRK